MEVDSIMKYIQRHVISKGTVPAPRIILKVWKLLWVLQMCGGDGGEMTHLVGLHSIPCLTSVRQHCDGYVHIVGEQSTRSILSRSRWAEAGRTQTQANSSSDYHFTNIDVPIPSYLS